MKITNRQTIELIFKSLVNWACLAKNVFYIGGREIIAVEANGIFHILNHRTGELILSINQDGDVEIHEESDWLNNYNQNAEL